MGVLNTILMLVWLGSGRYNNKPMLIKLFNTIHMTLTYYCYMHLIIHNLLYNDIDDDKQH